MKAEIRASDADNVRIVVTFREENKLKKLTKNHVGEKIHIYLGEELLSSPKIMQTIDSESFVFSGDFSDKTEEKFVRTVND